MMMNDEIADSVRAVQDAEQVLKETRERFEAIRQHLMKALALMTPVHVWQHIAAFATPQSRVRMAAISRVFRDDVIFGPTSVVGVWLHGPNASVKGEFDFDDEDDDDDNNDDDEDDDVEMLERKRQQSHQPMLAAAVNEDSVNAVRMLVEAKADVNMRDRFGWTPLHLCQGRNDQIADILIRAGADVNAVTTSEGESVLATATRFGDDRLVERLLAEGAARSSPHPPPSTS